MDVWGTDAPVRKMGTSGDPRMHTCGWLLRGQERPGWQRQGERQHARSGGAGLAGCRGCGSCSSSRMRQQDEAGRQGWEMVSLTWLLAADVARNQWVLVIFTGRTNSSE